MYKWDPSTAAELIEREKITSFIAPAAMTGDLVQEAGKTNRDLSTLASVGGGGASLGEKSLIRTNAAVVAENIQIGGTTHTDPEFANAFSCGPITINAGYTVGIDNTYEWTIIGGGNNGSGLYTRRRG